MKTLQKAGIILSILFVGIGNISAYSLTESDRISLDRIETKLFNIIDDSSNNITYDKIVDLIQGILIKRNFSDKKSTLLGTIADDISYHYNPSEFENDYYIYDENEGLDENINNDDQTISEEENINPIVTYRIEGSSFILLEDQSKKGSLLSDKTKREIIIKRFLDMVPSSYRKELTLFKFSDTDDTNTAFARENDETLSDWTISFNINGLFNEYGSIEDQEWFDIALIHEFAHVLTLNNTQLKVLDYTNGAPDCGLQLYTGEGCAKPDSFIDLFYKKFWKKEDYKIVGDSENGDEKLYKMKPNSFIRPYTATNPSEDIAESFAYFAIKEKPLDKSLIKNQKILFFYQYPSFVKLRQNIRKELLK